MKLNISLKLAFRILLCVAFVVFFLNVDVLAQGSGVIQISQRNVPVAITKPGSYLLTSNLVVKDPNVIAINILADNVTIDLNGFAIIGPGYDSGGAGLAISAGPNNISVRNGAVHGFGNIGVSLHGQYNNRAENLRVSSVRSCGIFVGRGGLIADCQIRGCGEGINVDDGSMIINNVLLENITGILMSGDCPAPIGGLMVIGNNCRMNGVGIKARSGGVGSRIEGNTITLNGIGIDLTDGTNNLFAKNYLQGNETAITGEGDDIDGGSIDLALSNIIR